MSDILNFVAHYGYALVFLWVAAEQLGMPLPAAPLLLAVGALAGTGRMNLAMASGLATAAALVADLFWYRVGRIRGTRVLGRLCRLALEPDSCVRKAEAFLSRHGTASLLVTKFIPGLNTVAAPLAGVGGATWWRFIGFDLAGTLMWVGTLEGLGFIFAPQLERIASQIAGAGKILAVLVVLGGAAAYIFVKYARRRRLLEELQMARITPEELKQKLDTKEPIAILDLRHPLDFLPQPYTIPGAIRIPIEQLENRQDEIPHDRELVVYCTCPNEASSAMTVIRLRQYGIRQVRPLAGGFYGWRERGFPVESKFGPPVPLKALSHGA